MKKSTRTAAKSKKTPKNVDEYLAAVPEPGRTTLSKVRAAIRCAVPAESVETISYGIPAFKYKRVLVWFAAFLDHCSFFPTAAVIDAFQDELSAYRKSKGTIHFPIDKPLPAALIKKMVRLRVSQVEGKT